MLVLTRRVGEELVIDGNVRLTVLDFNGQQVRLGVIASRSVAVDWREARDRQDGLTVPGPPPLEPR